MATVSDCKGQDLDWDPKIEKCGQSLASHLQTIDRLLIDTF